MVIRILDYVQTASSYEDGDVIFRKISSALKEDEAITISFKGISSVPSAFVNAAFIRLLEEVSFDKIKNKLLFTDTTKNINELIKSRFNFVLTHKA